MSSLDRAMGAANEEPSSIPVIGYLPQIEVVRLVTFACVIGVHSIAQAADPNNVAGFAVEVALHFTRAVFFILTGFVLFHTNYRRPLDVRRFWKKRIPVVALPYLAWSTVYFIMWLVNTAEVDLHHAITHYGWSIATGRSEYHMYFLLVSMQIYLLFPVFRWTVQHTEDHHRALLTGLFVANEAFLAWLHFYQHDSALGANAGAVVFTYTFYVFIGAIAAINIERLTTWVGMHAIPISVGVIAALAIAEGTYFWEIDGGTYATTASDALQPVMLIWSVAVALGLYTTGCWWASQRHSNTASRLFTEASLASFGIYLAHPLVLDIASHYGLQWDGSPLPTALTAVVAWLIAAGGSVAIIEVALRTPLSLLLTGRRRN